jgi:hypothetical protein
MTAKRKISAANKVFGLYARKRAKVTVRKLDRTTILIEGDKTAMEFLGRLFLAVSKSEHSVQISPQGAGSARFTKEATLGLYIHKLPCYRVPGKAK